MNIKTFITFFQVIHPYETGYLSCYVVPSDDGYSVVYDPSVVIRGDQAENLMLDRDTIVVDGNLCMLNINYWTDCIKIHITSQDPIHHDANVKLFNSYRQGIFYKQKTYSKFVESVRLTELFKQSLASKGVDLTIISSQTLIMIGILFHEFVSSRGDVSHQVCIDPFHNKYDVALIVK